MFKMKHSTLFPLAVALLMGAVLLVGGCATYNTQNWGNWGYDVHGFRVSFEEMRAQCMHFTNNDFISCSRPSRDYMRYLGSGADGL